MILPTSEVKESFSFGRSSVADLTPQFFMSEDAAFYPKNPEFLWHAG
jgi:hypothetical protein